MKLQGLAIIFIIIIMPITLVLSEYVNTRIKTATTELEYNTRLLNSTYDSIKAYQLNTVNNEYGDVTNSKISDIEAAINTFYNSLANNFNFTGYSSSIMKAYVPAVAFTLYDGYYIYSPFYNRIPEEYGGTVDYDENYSKPNQITNGLKPYVYYSSRYKYGSNSDFIINYTLDNYITLTGIINGQYVYDAGFLYPISGENSIKKVADGYSFNGITFKESDSEELKEYVGNKEYSYVKINGKKYYLEEEGPKEIVDGVNKNAKFFFINDKGIKNYSQVDDYNTNSINFKKYYFAIKNNKSAYYYYKRAYEFSNMVLGNHLISDYKDLAGHAQSHVYGLNDLKSSDSVYYDTSRDRELKESGITPLSEYGDYRIFGSEDTNQSKDIHLSASNFNKHRKSIIRYTIETNMPTAISNFKSNSVDEFIMPKISETDWETIENDVCEITFMQGLNLGPKKYNGYAVVANMLTKEYIDEDDIYILTNEHTYCKVNDIKLKEANIIPSKDTMGYYPGIWKISFERKKIIEEIEDENSIKNTLDYYYYPISFKTQPTDNNAESYLGSYTSIMGNAGLRDTELKTTEYPDMYTYVNSLDDYLRKTYYMSLARERWGSYNVNNINYEIYKNNLNDYYLKDY